MYWNCRFENKKKVFLAQTEDEFKRILKAIYSSTYTDNLIIQEFIPGDDSKMRVVNCYSDKNGKVRMAALGKILLEECSPDGIGSYAAIISDYDKEIIDMIIKFLEGIKFKGFSNFDIKYDDFYKYELPTYDYLDPSYFIDKLLKPTLNNETKSVGLLLSNDIRKIYGQLQL